jgi:hypothetical protein
MLLSLSQHPDESVLVEVLDPSALIDPFLPTVMARILAGEEPQDPHHFVKTDLRFPSGEPLPRCWRDPAYGG